MLRHLWERKLMTKPVDSEIVAAQLRGMQQDLRALEEALRQLTDALTEEEEAQLSTEAKAGLKRLRSRNQNVNVEFLLPKEAAEDKVEASKQVEQKSKAKSKTTTVSKRKVKSATDQ